jgi:UDP-2,4-diacetamido-2,4,6-trideoxy-beta-L-altropyranose hydrolase
MDCFPTKRLVFRADGNGFIGLGHVVRLLALADRLRGLAPGVFLVRTPSAAIAQLLADAGWAIQALPVPASSATEASWLAHSFLQPSDVLILDGYEFTQDYQQSLRQSGCGLVYIDDLCAWPVVADVLINHSPGIIPAHYKAPPTARLLLGPAFALLRRPFLEAATLPAQNMEALTSALVCFGGADPLGLTHRTLAALLHLPQLGRLSAVVGGAFGDATALQQLAAQHPEQTITIHRQVEAQTLVELLQTHAVIVAPASTVLIEALVLGRPVVTGYYAPNQQALASYVHTQQQAFSVGDFTSLPDDQLAAVVRQGLDFLASHPRQPYVTDLNPGLLRTEIERLLSR